LGYDGGLEVFPGAGKVSSFDIDLAQPHVHFGDGARYGIAPDLGRLQGTLVEPARRPRPAGREPQVSEHDRAAQLVDEAAARVQAGHGLGERLQRARHVPLRPRGEAQEPGGPSPREMVLGTSQVEGAPGVFRRACRIAA